jgi:periplasmic protein TonB
MFNTLESNWNQSARRGWTTLASFGFQAMALSLLLLIPLLTIQGPTRLELFSGPPISVPPPPAPQPPESTQRPIHSSNIRHGEILQFRSNPRTIANLIANLDERPIASAPDVSGIGVIGSTGSARLGAFGSTGLSVEIASPPPAPAPTHPLKVSHWAEGNLIYRVQPVYPPLARQARVQGSVELRAIISRTGTIENLIVVRGHPMLSAAAIDAVRRWRYRPYLLNSQPVEVETEITVNFLLSGGL